MMKYVPRRLLDRRWSSARGHVEEQLGPEDAPEVASIGAFIPQQKYTHVFRRTAEGWRSAVLQRQRFSLG